MTRKRKFEIGTIVMDKRPDYPKEPLTIDDITIGGCVFFLDNKHPMISMSSLYKNYEVQFPEER